MNDSRTDRLEAELRETKAELGKLRVELAAKPGKLFFATGVGVLIAAFALGLAARPQPGKKRRR